MINSIVGLPSVTRLSDSGQQAGIASNINIVSLDLADPDLPTSQAGLCVTPVRTQEGNLKLIAWRAAENGASLNRLADSGNQAGFVSGIAATRLSFQRIVTAVRSAEGRLKVIVWRISDGGELIERLGDNEGLEIPSVTGDLAVVTMNAGQIVTVARNTDGRLRLDHWGISVDGFTLTYKGGSGNAGNVITELAAGQQSFGRVVTAVRSEIGRLELQNWAVPPDNSEIILIEESASDAAGDGRQITLDVGSDVITAVRTLEGTLKLIRWNSALDRLGDSGEQGGSASRTAVVAVANDRYMTAARGSEGLLNVSFWRVNPNQQVIQKLAAINPSDQESIGEVALARVANHTITAIEDSGGRLKLIVWSE